MFTSACTYTLRFHRSVGAIWMPTLNIAVVVAAAAAPMAPVTRAAVRIARPPAAAQGSGARVGHQVILFSFLRHDWSRANGQPASQVLSCCSHRVPALPLLPPLSPSSLSNDLAARSDTAAPSRVFFYDRAKTSDANAHPRVFRRPRRWHLLPRNRFVDRLHSSVKCTTKISSLLSTTPSAMPDGSSLPSTLALPHPG